jgi:hypothetical protein
MILFFQTLSMKTRLVAVLVSFFLVFCVFYAFNNTPWFLVQLKQYSPDHSLPDQLFWYSPRDLHQILGAWGLVGRDFYRTTLFPLDLVFPVLYSAFFFVRVYHEDISIVTHENKRISFIFIPLCGTNLISATPNTLLKVIYRPRHFKFNYRYWISA